MKTPLSETPRKSRREISLSFFRREFRSIMQHPASAIHPPSPSVVRRSFQRQRNCSSLLKKFPALFFRFPSFLPLSLRMPNVEREARGILREIAVTQLMQPPSLPLSFPPTLPFHFPPNVMDGVHHSGSGAPPSLFPRLSLAITHCHLNGHHCDVKSRRHAVCGIFPWIFEMIH